MTKELTYIEAIVNWYRKFDYIYPEEEWLKTVKENVLYLL